MDLVFSDNYPNNAFLVNDSSVLYNVKTKIGLRPGEPDVITILKANDVEGQYAEMGIVVVSADSVRVWGKKRLPEKGLFDEGRTFKSSAKSSCQWKYTGGETWKLLVKGKSTLLARFDRAFTPQAPPPTLSVTSQGLAILDDIVTTFVYVERKRKEDIRNGKIKETTKRMKAEVKAEYDKEERKNDRAAESIAEGLGNLVSLIVQ
ncbi:hypothetical protein DXG01_007411 [Tephrocybe rancida]|nr:hypothetical protein DXG01_007411 [Tephrocybe rancida]